jgi:pyrimidine-specific ribonucleoside hydrolase
MLLFGFGVLAVRLSTDSLLTAKRQNRQMQAFDLAEAGADKAEAYLRNLGAPPDLDNYDEYITCPLSGTPATIGDAGAVCAVIDRDGVRTERLPVRVELAGSWSRGRTIVDRRDWSGDLAHDPHGAAPAMVDVCLSVDAQRYARLWLDTLQTEEA